MTKRLDFDQFAGGGALPKIAFEPILQSPGKSLRFVDQDNDIFKTATRFVIPFGVVALALHRLLFAFSSPEGLEGRELVRHRRRVRRTVP